MTASVPNVAALLFWLRLFLFIEVKSESSDIESEPKATAVYPHIYKRPLTPAPVWVSLNLYAT